MLTWLDRNDLAFPPVERALREPNGLLAAGGDLSPQRLVNAYRAGIFPWFEQGQPILWWSPDPRTVLRPDQVHVSRSLAKLMRQGRLHVTFDQAFSEVIAACAAPRNYTDQTWITDTMRQAYIQLHALGYAHSVEVWEGERLVGGLYGMAMGQLFFGESMFSRVDNASKVGFVTLAHHLAASGFVLIDCQMPTRHLESLGAAPIARAEFVEILRAHIDAPSIAGWQR